MIPISRTSLGEEEIKRVAQVIRSGWVTQGPVVKDFEEEFAAFVGASHACAASSCTTALHMALLVVGVQPGDVVLTVSHSFIATANAVRYCGAEPVFLDIDPATFNMTAEHLRACLEQDCERREGSLYYARVERLAAQNSPLRNLPPERIGRVAAVMPVHQMGMPCEIGPITQVAREYGLPVVEDAACAIGSKYSADGGTTWERIGAPHGDIACFSFHPRKMVTTGEGGMVTTSNGAYDAELRLLRHHGMDVSDLSRHGAKTVVIENYVRPGFNYRMSDIHAAVGIEQLRRLPETLAHHRHMADLYRAALSEIPWLDAPAEPDFAQTNFQSYPVLLGENAPLPRDALIAKLLAEGIASKPGIMNSHRTNPYQDASFSLPASERAFERTILLPMHGQLTPDHLERIVQVLIGT